MPVILKYALYNVTDVERYSLQFCGFYLDEGVARAEAEKFKMKHFVICPIYSAVNVIGQVA